MLRFRRLWLLTPVGQIVTITVLYVLTTLLFAKQFRQTGSMDGYPQTYGFCLFRSLRRSFFGASSSVPLSRPMDRFGRLWVHRLCSAYGI